MTPRVPHPDEPSGPDTPGGPASPPGPPPAGTGPAAVAMGDRHVGSGGTDGGPGAAAGSANWVEVRVGAYHDSVTLMRVSRGLGELDGVGRAMVAMGTELNRDLIAGMGFDVPPRTGPGDLVIAVRGDPGALDAARAHLENALAAAPTSGAAHTAPAARTVAAAVRAGTLAGTAPALALVSVPGEYAFAEAMDAIEAGIDVMVFSDNVPVAQEVALKRAAARRGRLVMGPDCGTAIVAGTALGFANVTRPGRVGVVAASGTGAQQVVCLLDEAGVGISHVLGVGGRDLSAEVGGLSTLAALDALDADPATELIMLLSKPPDPRVAATVRAHAQGLRTPVRDTLLGTGGVDLAAATRGILDALGVPAPEWPVWPGPGQRPRAGALRGLFAGGTLCVEALTIAAERLGRVRANLPAPGDAWLPLPDDLRADGHLMIDFGDDRLTRGRAHPMIDPTLRLERIAAEGADPACAVLLLDVVLGHGADPDPAGTLGPAIAAARRTAGADGRDLAVVVALIGASGDPQDRDRTAEILADAGARVFACNADAARHAASLIEPAS